MAVKVFEANIKDIKPYENNPRIIPQEAVDHVANSIKEFGMKVPIVVDKDMVIVTGHTRLKACEALGMGTVPCIMADDLTDEQIKAFRLADNKTNEFSSWDKDLLNIELGDLFRDNFDMEQFGFDWGLGEGDEDKEIIEDEVELDDVPTRCHEHEVWKLGVHTLMCGDSTVPEDVEKLMEGQKVDLVFTDPPYGMKKESEGIIGDNMNFDDLLDFNKKWIPLAMANSTDVASFYCWGIDEPLMDIYSEILKPMAKKNLITFRNLITWDKGNAQGQLDEGHRSYAVADEKCLFAMKGVQGFNTNSDHYFEGWEPIRVYLLEEANKVGLTATKTKEICGVGMYSHWFTKSQWEIIPEEHYRKLQRYYRDEAFKKEYEEIKKEYEEIKKEYEEIKKEYYSTRAYFDNTHDNMNNVWHFQRVLAGTEENKEAQGHATPKPVALVCRAVKSSSREGEKVLDLFGGSGTSIVACEQLGRVCYMMEKDPHYCDVIINRWEKLTGKTAERIA